MTNVLYILLFSLFRHYCYIPVKMHYMCKMPFNWNIAFYITIQIKSAVSTFWEV